MSAEILLKQDVAGATPPVGFATIYVKTDGKMYTKNDAGIEILITGAGGAVSNVVASSLTINADTSYIVASYLKVKSTLYVKGNLVIKG